MRKRTFIATTALLSLLPACSGEVSPPDVVGKRALEGDVCALFSTDEMARFVGSQVEAGRPLGSGEGCYYLASDSETQPTRVTVNVSSGDTPEAFARSQQVATDSAEKVIEIPGLGDQAFAYSSRAALLQSAEARLGGTRVRVLMQGLGANPGTVVTMLQQARDRLAAQ